MSRTDIRIIQMLPTLAYGDGVGNDTLAVDRILKEMGFSTRIYAENIDSRVSKRVAKKIEKMPPLSPEDVIIYHFSMGSKLNSALMNLPGKKIIIYHNITPDYFFKGYNRSLEELCRQGRNDILKIRDAADYCLTDSEYNKQELIEYGFRCNIDVLPILIPYQDYERKPNKSIIEKYEDDWVNIVFVGRIAPNKKIEDVISTFYYYKKYINAKSRLFLVGSYNGLERYYDRLRNYVQKLGIDDVYFTGHVRFDKILAYYQVADVFLCMSEHEGFCIPLVEAMFFAIPIIAYSATGVKETLDYAGLKLESKNCKLAAEMINVLIQNENLYKSIVELQNERLKEFDYDKTKESFKHYLEEFLE